MFNLIGAVPSAADVLRVPGAHLHLYGKEPRPGRKLGHVTLVEPTAERERHCNARVTLTGAAKPPPSAGLAWLRQCSRQTVPLMCRPHEGQIRWRRFSSSACFFSPEKVIVQPIAMARAAKATI